MPTTYRGVKCRNCTIEHGVAPGDRHPDACPICKQPYRFTPEQRAEIDRRTGYAPAAAVAAPAENGATEGAGFNLAPRLRELAEGCRDSAALSEQPGDEYPAADFAQLARHLDQLADLAAPAVPLAKGAGEGHSIRDRLAGDEGLTVGSDSSDDAARWTPGGDD